METPIWGMFEHDGLPSKKLLGLNDSMGISNNISCDWWTWRSTFGANDDELWQTMTDPFSHILGFKGANRERAKCGKYHLYRIIQAHLYCNVHAVPPPTTNETTNQGMAYLLFGRKLQNCILRFEDVLETVQQSHKQAKQAMHCAF